MKLNKIEFFVIIEDEKHSILTQRNVCHYLDDEFSSTFCHQHGSLLTSQWIF